jgi:1-acyl-sn-glycerol-3-phosphate acyltransferase
MHWVYYFGRGLIRGLVFPFATWKVKGRENIKSAGPYLIVCNHLHITDPPILAASLPLKCVFMAKEDLWHSRWARFWVENFGAFPVRRDTFDREAIRQAEHWLKRGVSVILFPEGGRSRTASLQEALPGASLIAQRAGVPILPVSITGTEKLRNLRRCLPRQAHVTVTFGEAFTMPPRNGRLTKAERDELTSGIMRKIAAILPPEYRGIYAEKKADDN